MKFSKLILVLGYLASGYAVPRDELTPYEGECEESPRAICALSSKFGQDDPSLKNVTTTNYPRCWSDADFWIQDTDKVLAPLDAIYNGTASVVAHPGSGDNGCAVQFENSTYAYQLRIGSTGAIKGTNRTRAEYDGNPFYMLLTYFNPKGAWDTSTQNLTTAGDVYMVSSQSYYQYGQQWTLNSTKSGEGFDIAGELTSHKYADLNGLWFRIGECDNFYDSWDYGTEFLITDCNVLSASLTGRITPEKAEVKVTVQVVSHPGNPTLDYTFTGSAIPGPKLLTTEASPVTDGKLNHTNKENLASNIGVHRGGWMLLYTMSFTLTVFVCL